MSHNTQSASKGPLSLETICKDWQPESSGMRNSQELSAPSDDGKSEGVQVGEIVQPKVKFNLLAAVGVQYSVTAAPVAIGTYLSLIVGLGGSPTYFWGYILTGFFQFAVALAVSELASAMPHSSGPAHWVIVLAPPRLSRLLGYMVGWSTNAGWFFVCAATLLYAAQLTMALVIVAHPAFAPTAWQTYLVYVAWTLLSLIINLPGIFQTVNYLLKAVIFTLNGTAIYLFVSLLVKASPKQNAHTVFIEFVNESGWKSDGWVFFLALLPAMACLGGMDNVTHITDEVADPDKQIPQVILGTFTMNFWTALPMILVYQFCNVDPASLLTAVGGQPMIQLLLDAYNSVPLTIVTGAIIIYAFFVASAASLVSWSRLYWSFSREAALPFSGTMSKLTSRDKLPVNALLWNSLLIMAIGAISIGSYTAMNAILGAAIVCLLVGIIVSLGLAIYRGRTSLRSDRWFSLGQWGTAIYWVAELWTVFILVTLNFPLYLPVTPDYMNWTSAVLGGVFVVASIYYIAYYAKGKHNRTT